MVTLRAVVGPSLWDALDGAQQEFLARLLDDVAHAAAEPGPDDAAEWLEAVAGVVGVDDVATDVDVLAWLRETWAAAQATAPAPAVTVSVVPLHGKENDAAGRSSVDGPATAAPRGTGGAIAAPLDDEVKKRIVSAHFVETVRLVNGEEQTHRPTLRLNDDKKSTRYRDNKVVSTRGEREIVEKAEEDAGMKATYVHLRPLKAYRFH